MVLSLSVLAPPPVLDALAADATLADRWLLEAWFIRVRWVALPLGVLAAAFIPRLPWPVHLVLPLALALGNGWLVWRLRRVRSGASLRRVREIATGLDWLLGLLALGVSAGTAVHEALPAILLLLVLATTSRYGPHGLLAAAAGSACLAALLVSAHVVLFGALTWRAAAGALAGWELMIGLTALLGWALLGARGEQRRREVALAARSGAPALVCRPEMGLTKREWDILPLLAREELTYAAIGDRLHIGEETVKTHVHRLGAKLGVSRRREIVAEARQHGLLPPQSDASD